MRGDDRLDLRSLARKIAKNVHVGGAFRSREHAVDFFESARERVELAEDGIGEHGRVEGKSMVEAVSIPRRYEKGSQRILFH